MKILDIDLKVLDVVAVEKNITLKIEIKNKMMKDMLFKSICIANKKLYPNYDCEDFNYARNKEGCFNYLIDELEKRSMYELDILINAKYEELKTYVNSELVKEKKEKKEKKPKKAKKVVEPQKEKPYVRDTSMLDDDEIPESAVITRIASKKE